MEENFLRSFLEIKLQDDFKPSAAHDSNLRVVEMAVKQWQFNKFLYGLVGSKWAWIDKLQWSDEEWQNYVNNPDLMTFVGYHCGSVAGYFELVKVGSEFEITYLGLVNEFIGKGLGGQMLNHAIKRGFDSGASRIWLTTCSRDHPASIPNYLSRGMKVYKTETEY